jgi:hypothetical protein
MIDAVTRQLPGVTVLYCGMMLGLNLNLSTGADSQDRGGSFHLFFVNLSFVG